MRGSNDADQPSSTARVVRIGRQKPANSPSIAAHRRLDLFIVSNPSGERPARNALDRTSREWTLIHIKPWQFVR